MKKRLTDADRCAEILASIELLLKYFCLSFMEIFFPLFILGQALDAGRNIVFLVDGSDNASDRFTTIREFVASLAETFDVGQEKDQIAVVQFSNTAATS